MMPRPKTFDESAVLTQSMSVFWKRGYERTSMKDIERATKLSAGSVYHEFGGKKTLFERSLNHYIEQVIGKRIQTYLMNVPSPLGGIREFLISSFQHVPKEFAGQSCLLVNSAAELGQEDEDIGNIIKAGFKKLEIGMTKAFVKAQEAGELSSDITPSIAAKSLCLLMPGLLIAVKNGSNSENLGPLIDFHLSQLTSPKS